MKVKRMATVTMIVLLIVIEMVKVAWRVRGDNDKNEGQPSTMYEKHTPREFRWMQHIEEQ